MEEKGSVIANICHTLTDRGPDAAARLLRKEYPFCPEKPSSRKYGPQESTKIFIRDRFLDRYSGSRLVFPPVLRLLSLILPDSAKGNWTLADLGWTLFPPGIMKEWDGLMSWYVDYCRSRPEIMTKSWAKAWYREAIRLM